MNSQHAKRITIAAVILFFVFLIALSFADHSTHRHRRWRASPEEILEDPLFMIENVQVAYDTTFSRGYPVYYYTGQKYHQGSVKPQPAEQFGVLILQQNGKKKFALSQGYENSETHITRIYTHVDGQKYLLVGLKNPAEVRTVSAVVLGYDAEGEQTFTSSYLFDTKLDRHVYWTQVKAECARYEIEDIVLSR